MADITVGIRKAHGSTADQIPVDILKALPQAELLDRLAHAEDLATRTRDPQLAGFYDQRAQAVLAAPPRAEVAKEIARRYLQAARTRDPRQAKALRDGACKLIEQHPPAPTRAEVAKARARTVRKSGRVEVYNASGDLVGDIDRSNLYPVLTPEEQAANRFPVRAGGTTGLGRPRVTGPAAALPGDGPQQSRPGDMPGRTVVKAGAKSGSGEQVAVYNQGGDLVGIVDPGDITPLSEPKVSVGNPRDPDAQPPAEAGTPAAGEIAKAAADRALSAFAAGLTRQRAAQATPVVDVAKARVAKAALRNAVSPAEQNRIANEMQASAIATLAAIHGRGAGPRRRQ